jgi:phenylalanine-4-hydroxylase
MRSSPPLPSLGAPERIPRFDEISERLHRATGWEIVAVPGLIPEVPFFTLLAHRKFPVTDWIRSPRSSTTSSSPTSFTTCSAMCRCCSTRCLPTTCSAMAPAG